MIISRFSLKDKIFFLKELSYLLNWWVSIPVALETIQNNTENDTIRQICSEIYTMIKQWETLSRSLRALDEYFTEWDVNIISSWEGIWELPRVLKQLANEYENIHSIKTRYIWAMIYPMILLLIIIWALVIVFKMIIPWFLNIVSGFPDVELPESTKLLISINHYIQQHWQSIFVLFAGVLVIVFLFLSTEDWRKFLSGLVIKIPVFWKIFKLYYVVYFLRYFSLLIYSWLPITKVFLYLRWIVSNPYYVQMCDEILNNLNKWESFTPVMKKYTDIIPSDVVVLIKVWEETANLQEAAQNAIVLYEEEFNKIVDSLSKIIEPIMILLIGWIIGFVAISMFGVIWAVLDSLRV